MQKLPFFFAVLMLLASNAPASNLANTNPGIFQDDLSKLEADMAGLNALEQWIGDTDVTYSQLLAQGNPLAQAVMPDSSIVGSLVDGSAPEHERLMDIPGFLWGFCCSFVGVFLVYLSVEDPKSKKREGVSAIIGCAIGTVIWAVLYIWLIVFAAYY